MVGNLLNIQLPLKVVLTILLSGGGAAVGAVKLTDWAEHRVTTDEALLGTLATRVDSIAKSADQISISSQQLAKSVQDLDKSLTVHVAMDSAWEAKVNMLSTSIQSLWHKINGPAAGAKMGDPSGSN